MQTRTIGNSYWLVDSVDHAHFRYGYVCSQRCRSVQRCLSVHSASACQSKRVFLVKYWKSTASTAPYHLHEPWLCHLVINLKLMRMQRCRNSHAPRA